MKLEIRPVGTPWYKMFLNLDDTIWFLWNNVSTERKQYSKVIFFLEHI